jgi:predicted RNase H-like HicB family nuclease
MLIEYVNRALRKAKYEKLEDGSFFATVRGLRGVWANEKTLEGCRDELAEVIEGWVLVRVAHGLDVPAVGGVRINVKAMRPRKPRIKTVA